MSQEQFDLVLEPRRSAGNYWRDLWQYRGLFYFLSWRDILVRYKQTVIGVAWSVIRPLLTMIVFTVVFGRLAQLPSEGAPYLLLVCAAMLPWQFFSNAFTESSQSLIANAPMLTKVYFPRLIIPASAVVVALVDFLISLVILLALMAWYRFVPGWQIVWLPVFLLLAVLVSLGAGFLVAALNVRYRDFRYVVPFIVQFGLYVSPVGFSSSVIPEDWRWLYSLNPMVGVIDGFRWSLLGGDFRLHLPGFLVSVTLAVALFLFGLSYFRRMEKSFADVI